MSETVHVAFRSAETGRYLFHDKWPAEVVEQIEKAAALEGLTFEEFVIRAIREYIEDE